MKTKEQIEANYKAQLAKAETENSILEYLRNVPGVNLNEVQIALYDWKHAHASVTLWTNFRTSKKLSDAVKIVQHFKAQIITGEHWKSGCVSTWPAEINSCINDDGAVMDGSHAVEIEASGGRGYGPDIKICFWVKLGGTLCEIHCPVGDQWRLIPAVKGRYNQDGDFVGKIEWNPAETQTADCFRKFWSEPPSYRGSYYMADFPKFISWAGNHGAIIND